MIVSVDPADLRLPPARRSGADPFELAEQIRRFGDSLAGMPRVLVTRGAAGAMMINDGVTRATRVAKLRPGTIIEVEVIEEHAALSLANLVPLRET